jgi:hypothetical protein
MAVYLLYWSESTFQVKEIRRFLGLVQLCVRLFESLLAEKVSRSHLAMVAFPVRKVVAIFVVVLDASKPRRCRLLGDDALKFRKGSANSFKSAWRLSIVVLGLGIVGFLAKRG